MAKKISQLTQATEVKSDDVTVIVQDGETKKLPLNMMVTKQDIENKKIAGLAKLDEIEATYENDTYTPTITVKNKSSVKTGEGDEVDYSANVMDGHAKSAILSGNTLVNLAPNDTFEGSATNRGQEFTLTQPIQPNKQYILLVNITKDDTVGGWHCRFADDSGNYPTFQSSIKGVGLKKVVFTTSIALSKFFPYFEIEDCEQGRYITMENVMLLEYQQGMENWDIPYFEGMQSVKLPVLMTTGKNLFNGEWELGSIHPETGGDVGNKNCIRTKDFFVVESNKEYTISNNKGYTVTSIFYDYAKNLISTSSAKTFITPSNSYFVKFRTSPSKFENDISIKFQIEQGSISTSYEPYKSNILTVNEEVELRGIGKGSNRFEDELDCLTEQVTERIGEIALDGSEDWQHQTNATDTRYTIYRLSIPDIDTSVNNSIVKCICDKAKVGSWIDIYTTQTDKTFAILDNQQLRVQFNGSVEGLKSWLASDKPTVQYLKTESIKTVDLMPSGTHPSTTPYCWKNGHIQLSSSGLLPNLEYSVVTSRAGQINQNATMIVKNDKRIFDLEILLAGGLVNTTYQALILQNQVETGLSKVSLSSETEPDYLLYHMIMKLIEEKAYKLDDLTEKVSVFYLYEKLSDEQFETIYSALYPFVEDEIVEEPVVEELPEVVEDEVIM